MSQECLSPFKNKSEQTSLFMVKKKPSQKNLFFFLLYVTVSLTHRSCPVVDRAVCGTKRKEILSLPKLTVYLLSNLRSKNVEKDRVCSAWSQTSLNKIGSFEKAVKHAVEQGVNALLASHSSFGDSPQITFWEHLTTKTLS